MSTSRFPQLLLEILRGTLVSPEALSVAIGLLAVMVFPAVVTDLWRMVAASEKGAEYVLFLPAGLLIWVASAAKSVLLPRDDGRNAALLAWPDYWRLRVRVFISVAYCVIAAIIGILLFLMKKQADELVAGLLVWCCLSVAMMSATCVWLAQLNIRTLLESKDPFKSGS